MFIKKPPNEILPIDAFAQSRKCHSNFLAPLITRGQTRWVRVTKFFLSSLALSFFLNSGVFAQTQVELDFMRKIVQTIENRLFSKELIEESLSVKFVEAAHSLPQRKIYAALRIDDMEIPMTLSQSLNPFLIRFTLDFTKVNRVGRFDKTGFCATLADVEYFLTPDWTYSKIPALHSGHTDLYAKENGDRKISIVRSTRSGCIGLMAVSVSG